jgi:hypothetical protein
MKSSAESSSTRDILQRRGVTAALFGIPVLAIVASGSLAPGSLWLPIIWVVALTTMGLACTVNAWRCGRIHSYITGPLLLLGALVALLDAVGIIHLSRTGWNMVAGALIVGSLLAYSLESAFGRYRGG